MAPKQWNIIETKIIERHKTSNGDKIVNNYKILHTLGHGRLGKVKLCERMTLKTNESSQTLRKFAVKIYSKRNLSQIKEYSSYNRTKSTVSSTNQGINEDTEDVSLRAVSALDKAYSEITIMRTLYHRNIVLLFETLDDPLCDKLYLVMEYMPKGQCMTYDATTHTFISPITQSVLTEELARSHIQDIINGLEYLHSRGICHRDIKPENILLNDTNRCHITDFGCASIYLKDPEIALTRDTAGTYPFFAPECVSGELFDPFKVDLWSIGICLLIFITGQLPYSRDIISNPGLLFQEIAEFYIQSYISNDMKQKYSPDLWNFLFHLLERNPTERMTIKEALIHPFLNKGSDESSVSTDVNV